MFLRSKFISFLQLVVLLTVVSQSSGDPYHRWHKSKIAKFFKNWWYRRHHCLLEEPCKTSLPQHASKDCLKERKEDIFKARLWYQLTNENEAKRTEFPLPEIPFLDQSVKSSQFFYTMDPFEGRYMAAGAGTFEAYGSNLVKDLVTKYANFSFNNPEDYVSLYEDADIALKKLRVPHVLSNPSQDPSTFTDIVTTDKWMEDDYFVQQLLTRDCPFLFKKVTISGDVGVKMSELKSVMHSSFSFDHAFAKVFEDDNMTFEKAVEKGLVFVIYNEQMNDMESAEDFYKGKTGQSRVDDITSPIAYFVSKNGNLKVVAIQRNATQDSHVSTSSSSDWLKEKASFYVSQSSYCQGYYHGGHYHVVGTVFCASFRRHFATKHPLYILFKYHCEGTIPHIALAFPSIILPNGTSDKMWSIGSAGVGKLAKKAFTDRQFGKLDLPNLLKDNGLDSKDTIDYFPFRDDSQLLWNELTRFLNEFVREIYHDSRDVQEDTELQSFANEISFEGNIEPDGGKGKFIGFPPMVSSKHQLAELLRSILWYNVLHNVANYGTTPMFLPFRSTKIYSNPGKDKFLNYGPVQLLAEVTQFRNILINLRVNRILSYYEKIEDEILRHIVWKSYSRFHGCIQKTLQKRNAVRKSKGMLGMQILEPKWLTNSMHI